MIPFVGVLAQEEFVYENGVFDNAPFSSKPFVNNPKDFQFIIVSDRTGGHREGVFAQGIKKINLLQPEFVMSVGDLIEGYTENEEIINQEWDEFMDILSPLDSRFFFVPGNHDYTNKTMGDIWKDKFGPSYYHFIYKDVLFLSLNSEDNFGGDGKPYIGQTQFEYFEKVLQENEKVRWTFVFMHQPIWTNTGETGKWNLIQELLANRQHTVFAGHVHQYTSYEINNMNYITLATLGGVSGLRGKAFGEFDHVTWVTMKDQGPVISNLMLDGIEGASVTVEKTTNIFNRLSQHPILKPSLNFIDSEKSDTATIELVAENYLTNYSVEIIVEPMSNEDIIVANDPITLYLEPKDKLEIALPATFLKSKVEKPVVFQLSNKLIARDSFASRTYDTNPYLIWQDEFSYLPQELYPIETLNSALTLDGSLEDWNNSLKYPVESKTTNARFDFSLVQDDTYFYVGIDAKDPTIVKSPKTSTGLDFEGAFVNFDVRDINISAYNKGDINELLSGMWFGMGFTITEDYGTIDYKHLWPEGMDGYYQLKEGGYTAEFKFPKYLIKSIQGDAWEYLRFNVGINDKVINENGEEVVVPVYWTPLWDKAPSGSGTFRRK